jgi:hydroxyacyl-ACP dehydratase HTD2-like protein with hotdog domain
MTVTATDTVRTVDQVSVDDTLPPLSYDVTATTVVLGALASRDWRPQHHDYAFATGRNGVKDIFLNSPNQAAWLERYVTDWTGPRGRMGKLGFRMLDSIFPGDTMTFNGTVTSTETDDAGCGWVGIDITVTVGERTCTTAKARVALPSTPEDNPWSRKGENWKP